MSALLNEDMDFSIEQDIQKHCAWLGRISGLAAEKMCRKAKPFQYVLRAGENESDYYVTFMNSDGFVKHQPFVITVGPDGWSYENVVPNGPFGYGATIEDVLHLIMHCHKNECSPLVQK